jgi:membrane protein DedA with SNARE-associated domain
VLWAADFQIDPGRKGLVGQVIPLLASISSTFTEMVSHDGLLAVAVLMAVDALLPAGGGVVMLLAGALAAGVFAGHHPTLFGLDLGTGLGAYVALASAGTLGYLVGALAGWLIGRRGGRPFLERWGDPLHLGPANMARAEGWFARHGQRAVFLGRLIPVVRSFISIPAGVLGSPLNSYVPLTLAGSALWCFAVAAAGWALGASYDAADGAFRAVETGAVVVIVLGGGALFLRRRAARREAG